MQFLLLNLKKLFSEAGKKSQVVDLAHFDKKCVFRKNQHPSSISYFSTGRKYLLRLKSSFSWSAAHALSNDVKKDKKKILLEVWIAGTLNKDENLN